MPGYRFCRADDIPLLAEAYNACYADHVDGAVRLTADELKREIRELDLWASSSVVAIEGDEPVGVLLAAKREHETLIHSVGVHPDHRRRGHGRHLLDSLRQKLVILGPPRLVAEVPEDWAEARSFFESCGYRPEWSCADFALASPAPPVDAGPLAVPIALDDVVESGAWDHRGQRSWARSLETLRHRREQLEGLAVASDERIEAWLLSRRNPAGEREIVALGAAPGGRSSAILGILIHHLSRQESSTVTVPRICPGEVDFALLESWGFRRTAGYVAHAIDAAPGLP
jgi:GNAT superfamily N-acetyltransferase